MLDEKAKLIKRKVERIVKENDKEALDFLLILLSNDGYISLKEIQVPFEKFISKYGNEKYENVKKRLIEDEAIIRETPESLELNHYKREEVTGECTKVIFELKQEEYLSKVKTVMSIAEGEYILMELVGYYYTSIGQDKMGQLEKDVGKKHFSKIIEQMQDSGIIFKYGSEPQIYWRLLTPIRDLFSLPSDRDKEALSYIYIAQEVRSEGVLQLDCAQYRDVIPRLLFAGIIKEDMWYAHRLYRATEKGVRFARQIILERLNKQQLEIEKLLDSGPSKLIRFILQEIFLAVPRAHPEVLFPSDVYCEIRQEGHRCLLKDPKIRDWRNKILAKLKESGLTYLAHSYVATRGGEIRELNYCIPPEVTDFFTNYLTKKGDIDIFTSEMESIHKSYHFLEKLSYFSEIDNSRVLSFANLFRMGMDESQRLLNELIKNGTIEKSMEGYKIKEPIRLSSLAEENLQMIVDYLFEKEIKSKISITPPPPKPPIVKPIVPRPIPPPIPGDLSVLLGYNIENNSPVIWQLSKEKNPHILVVGTTGAGKTETLKALVFELKKRGISCLILDFHNEYSEVVDLAINIREGVTINPLELFERSPLDTIYETSSILREIYGLGDQQEAELKKAIKKSYEDKGITDKDKSTWSFPPPNFADVKNNLEEMIVDSRSRNVINPLLNRLEPIFDIEIFSKETTIPFEKIVKQSVAVQLKDLPTDEVKTAASDFFLRRLWYYIYKMGHSKDLRLYCVIDEGHRLAYEKSPLDQLLREARKFGVGVILSSQRPSDFKEIIVANVATFVCFQCPLESDAKFMAKQLNCNPEKVQFLEERGKAVAKFSSSKTPIDVYIVPLSQRR